MAYPQLPLRFGEDERNSMTTDLTRRHLLGVLAGGAAAAIAAFRPVVAQAPTPIVVYKDPT
jgi:hypothetical protein